MYRHEMCLLLSVLPHGHAHAYSCRGVTDRCTRASECNGTIACLLLLLALHEHHRPYVLMRMCMAQGDGQASNEVLQRLFLSEIPILHAEMVDIHTNVVEFWGE